MNILFICDEYPPGKNGGIGSATRTLARELVKQGHSVFVAGLYPLGYGQKDEEEDHGVRIWRMRHKLDLGLIKNNYGRTDGAILKGLTLSGVLSKEAYSSVQRFFKFVTDMIIKQKIDIIEWPDWNNYFKYLSKLPERPQLRIPVVIKFHGSFNYIAKQMDEPIDKKIFEMEKQHIDTADAMVAVSNNTKKDVRAFYQIQKDIHVLYNSIEVAPLTRQVKEFTPTVVFTGALSKLKGVYSLMKAWNIVAEKFPSAKLQLYGKGKERLFSRELNSSALPSVQFMGHVSKDRLQQALSNAALAIFPSFTECFALGPLEAMSAGCPVIFTKRASGPELISDGENGLLIEPENFGEMASAILKLLGDASLRDQFSIAGRQTIEERFTIEQSANDHLVFYSEVKKAFKKEKDTT